MLTAKEKDNARKFPEGAQHLTNGMADLGAVCATHAHILPRDDIANAMQASRAVWVEMCEWFADLSGTAKDSDNNDSRDRASVVLESKAHYNALMPLIDALIASTSTHEEMSAAQAHFIDLKSTLSTFDWSLQYLNPRHDDKSITPWDEPRRVTGPHGDWGRSTASLKYASIRFAAPMSDLIETYRTVPVYTEIANDALRKQWGRLVKVIGLLSRMWAMHIEVFLPSDLNIINADHAASPPEREIEFLVTIYQTELGFNNRLAAGKNFRGRNLVRGAVEELRSLYYQEFIVPLSRNLEATTPGSGVAWVKQLVVGDGNGGLFGFHARMSDAWQALDSWLHAAIGMYHSPPDPAIFEVVTPDQTDGQEPEPAKFPIGYFDQDVALLEEARAGVAGVAAKLQSGLANLRAKEGGAI